MESAGLVTRRRNPQNRRAHVVELTTDGDALFVRLREAALGFDARLRSGLGESDLATVEELLSRLRANAVDGIARSAAVTARGGARPTSPARLRPRRG